MAVITSLISYWSLDEASGNALDAHGSNPLTDVVGVSAGTGVVAGARSYVSASAYFTHADNADLSAGDTDFSFQAWVKLTDKLASRVILRKWDGGGTEYIFWYDFNVLTSDRFSLAVRSGGGTLTHVEANTLGSPSTGTWYLVHGWHDSVNNLIGISVNAGTADTNAHSAGVADTSAVFDMGHSEGTSNEDMVGLIDEAAMWRKVLSSTERTWLYNAGAGRSYADLVAEAGSATPPTGHSTGFWD